MRYLLGEIRQGIERLKPRDPTAANRLEVWLQGLYGLFGERVLPITREIAEEWGRLNAQRPLPAADSLLGATANVHRLVLATRNVTWTAPVSNWSIPSSFNAASVLRRDVDEIPEAT